MDTDRGGPDAADGTEEPGEPGEPGDLNDGLTLPGPDPPADLVEGAVDEGWAMQLFRNGRTNALIAWAMVTVLAGCSSKVCSTSTYSRWLSSGASPPSWSRPRSRRARPRDASLGLLGLALLPILVRALLGGELGIFATYLAIAALALAITVDLHMFTTLRVTHWFAVVLVVMTTMATAAVWTILRWNADRMYDTAYLSTNEALMIEWIYVTLAGIVAGTLFDAYFRQRGVRLRRALQRVVRR